MKHNFYLAFVLALVLTFVACDKEEQVMSLSGSQFETTYFRMDFTGNLLVTFEFTTLEECKAGGMYSIIEFKSNGDFYAANEHTGTWSLDGSSLTIIENGVEKSGIVEGDLVRLFHSESTDDGIMEMKVEFTRIIE